MKVLVVVDMQNDFVDGALGSEQAKQIVPTVCEKIKEYQQKKLPIFVTMDTHDENYLFTLEGNKLPIPHCIKDTKGWELHPDILNALSNGPYHVALKDTFGDIHLPELMINVDMFGEIEVCGLCTDICVTANVNILRSAFPNTFIKVDSNACAGTSKEAHDAALLVMKSIQVDVI